jgi:hypothetical protein
MTQTDCRGASISDKKPLAPITKQDNFTHIAAKKFSSRLPLFLIQFVALQSAWQQTKQLGMQHLRGHARRQQRSLEFHRQ